MHLDWFAAVEGSLNRPNFGLYTQPARAKLDHLLFLLRRERAERECDAEGRRASSLRRRPAGLVGLAFGSALSLAAAPAAAGPPYVTDDPEPADTGHWEIYAFGSGTNAAGETAGQGGVDVNYGAAKDLQLTIVVPVDYDKDASYRFGAGDVTVGAKYRFLHQSQGSWLPDVSLFPQVQLPTASGQFCDGRAGLFLPLWAEKDLGDWSTFGGGGYQINPGPGNRNFWLTGWALTRKITDKLELGAEIYHQTSNAIDKGAVTAVGAGLIYHLTSHLALIGSGGPSLQAGRGAQQSAFYAALEVTY